MAHAVEGRFPFLDHRVVEFAARIPPRLKIRGLREKHILREAMHGLLPAAHRQPHQAALPRAGQPVLRRRAARRPMSATCCPAATIAAAGYFDPGAVGKLAAKCRKQPLVGFRDNMAFVGILSTQLWHREFVAGRDHRTPTSPTPLHEDEKDRSHERQSKRKVRNFIEENFLFREDRAGAGRQRLAARGRR